jgi:nitrogen regulatory protein PII
MKEVKAYMRSEFLDSTIRRLEEAGAKDITVTRVDAIDAMADYEMDRWHILRKYNEIYSSIARLEIICLDDQAMKFMQIIKEGGHTGESGDGRIFLSTIEHAINIKTGEEGEKAL